MAVHEADRQPRPCPLHQQVRLEVRPHYGSDVVHSLQGLEEPDQLQQLRVGVVVVPGLDGHSVVVVVAVGVRGVVHQQSRSQIPPQHMQVLEVVPLHQQARLSEQSVLDQLPGGIQLVQQRVRVHLLRSSEHDHLEAFADRLEEIVQVGALAYVHLVHLPVERDGEYEVWLGNWLHRAVH
eukprot:CAMPEP_0173232584 /NCGR_PEP_ID=MMETSP1142-20121109/9076_1 /TAXON_ID=483371 /ORGANISM="non described non described, Strain CCMP2298" /LENGTH=179 /DNA_ID=CAMNT_0014162179 /DNA_START=72 /DNA_END=612 /DNA_ORIENTATION=+